MLPEVRLRRLRRNAAIRRMLDAPLPGPEKFMWPTFVIDGTGRREAIDSMPGQHRLSIDELLRDLQPVAESGIGSILLFGLADDARKDAAGSEAWNADGTVQRAIRAVKKEFPDLIVAAEACVCAYTDHGHCGPLTAGGEVDNDDAIGNLAKICVSHAAAGADIVAPSAMMDGQVQAIREGLDADGFKDGLLVRSAHLVADDFVERGIPPSHLFDERPVGFDA